MKVKRKKLIAAIKKLDPNKLCRINNFFNVMGLP